MQAQVGPHSVVRETMMATKQLSAPFPLAQETVVAD